MKLIIAISLLSFAWALPVGSGDALADRIDETVHDVETVTIQLVEEASPAGKTLGKLLKALYDAEDED